MKRPGTVWLPLVALLTALPARAALITFDFEGFADSTLVGSTYSAQGAIFTNALAITAGLSLNDAEFPPRSGLNAAFDGAGPIRIDFSGLAGSFGAYFTYAARLHVAAFNSANLQVGSATSAFSSNFVSSGNSPNELLQIVFGAGIAHIVITGDAAGGSFVMDDVSFDTTIQSGGGGIPEPRTTGLCLVGLLGIAAAGYRRRDRR